MQSTPYTYHGRIRSTKNTLSCTTKSLPWGRQDTIGASSGQYWSISVSMAWSLTGKGAAAKTCWWGKMGRVALLILLVLVRLRGRIARRLVGEFIMTASAFALEDVDEIYCCLMQISTVFMVSVYCSINSEIILWIKWID